MEWYSLHRSLAPPLSVPSTYPYFSFPPNPKKYPLSCPLSPQLYTQSVVSIPSHISPVFADLTNPSTPNPIHKSNSRSFYLATLLLDSFRLSPRSHSLPHFHRTRKVNRPTPLPSHIRLSSSRSPSFGFYISIFPVSHLFSLPTLLAHSALPYTLDGAATISVEEEARVVAGERSSEKSFSGFSFPRRVTVSLL